MHLSSTGVCQWKWAYGARGSAAQGRGQGWALLLLHAARFRRGSQRVVLTRSDSTLLERSECSAFTKKGQEVRVLAAWQGAGGEGADKK